MSKLHECKNGRQILARQTKNRVDWIERASGDVLVGKDYKTLAEARRAAGSHEKAMLYCKFS